VWDFSGDEWLFFLAAAVAGGWGLVKWYTAILRVSPAIQKRATTSPLIAAPVLSLILLGIVLNTWADPVSVAGHFDYVTLFLLGGAAWLAVSTCALPLLGLSLRQDAVERHNPAATVAISGATFGVTVAYAYSNIGNGPTIWTTLVPAFVATLCLFILWALAEWLGGPLAESITVDRDLASGLRLAALLLGAGAVLGRAMAGDFADWPSTFADFARLAWPAVLLALLAAAAQRFLRPTPQAARPSIVSAGLIPSALILLLAGAYVVSLGPPEVKPAPPATSPAGPER
jgi:uncharacterized membrane protein YjfL (UPF0719 family)